MKKSLLMSLSLASLLTLAGCGVSFDTSAYISIGEDSDEEVSQSIEDSSDAASETNSISLSSNLKPIIYDIPETGLNTEEEIEITFYSTMGDSLQKVFNVYLEEFNELYPNIKVNHEQPGGYDDVRNQIKTELSSGLHPNVAYCYPDHVALYNKAKAVVTLDNFINDDTYGISEEVQNDFVPGYWNEGLQFGNGYMYTLPFSKSTEVLYYNKTFFEEHDLKVPTTWAEMDTTLAAIKAIDPNSIPLGYDSEANLFITLCEQLGSPYTTALGSGADHFLFNNETNKSFVSMLKNWYDQGYLTTSTLYGTYTSGLFVETATESQKSYMSIGSSAGASHQVPTALTDGKLPFEVGIASIPQVDANNGKVISQGPSVCIFKDDDPQKVLASWLLVRFLTTSVEFQAEFSMASGYVPVLKSVATNPVYAEFLAGAGTNSSTAVVANSAKVCMEQEDWYYTSPAFMGSSEARDQVGSLLTSVFAGSQTIDEAFEYAIEMCIANS